MDQYSTQKQERNNVITTSSATTQPQEKTRRWRRPRRRNPQQPTVTQSQTSRSVDFGELLVSETVARALDACGYDAPTPVQAECIMPLLEGRDVVGKARTGTGKTAAFGIPLAHITDPSQNMTQAIVMVPTRELAMQACIELQRICQFSGLKVAVLYGGQSIRTQIDALRRGAQIVVGTPGRVLDHLSRRTLVLDGVRLAIVDEVDRMFDAGFAPDIEDILRQVPKTRQTAVFSATIPLAIQRLINRHLVDPVWVNIAEQDDIETQVEQVYYEVANQDKLDGLRELLDKNGKGTQTLVFRRTQIGVDRLVSQLRRRGLSAEGIHGGMTQSQRNQVMQSFRSGNLHLLVATDVASRGLDIPSISHVINFDMPGTVEEYVHRTGRTGRMGRAGIAITFVSELDLDLLDELRTHLGDELKRGILDMYR